jgi:hypothetical protein
METIINPIIAGTVSLLLFYLLYVLAKIAKDSLAEYGNPYKEKIKGTHFYKGQVVTCFYYQEYKASYEPKAYKRTLFEKVFYKRLKLNQPKLGKVIGSAGEHLFWLSTKEDGKEQYLYVKIEGYLFAKPIPISCIKI